MKPLLDLFPIGVFVAAYFVTHDFFTATIALMAATAAQVALTWLLTRVVGQQLWVTFWLVLVLGGLTVVLHDKTYLVWKPSVVDWVFAVGLLVGQAFGRNPLRLLLGNQLTLPDYAWRHLSYGWAAGFVLAGVLNLWVAFNFSESFWVYYKLWGGFALTLVNIIASALYLSASGLLDELPPATDGDGAATTAAALSDTALPQPGATGDTDLADGQSRHGNGGRT